MNDQSSYPMIVIQEDDQDDRLLFELEFLNTYLTNRMFFVEDEDELLKFLLHRGKFTDPITISRPSLILMNFYPPEYEFSKVISRIKIEPEIGQIPLVLMFSSEFEKGMLASSDVDALGYLIKPVTFSQLDALLKRIDQA